MRVLFCPIFSMRSYKTGKYSILKDGNFQLAMSRVLASDFDAVTVTVPDDASDFEETIKRFEMHTKVNFVEAKYGENAVQTRKSFWDQNQRLEMLDIDILITDITGYPGKSPVIYNFNITKLPELNRPYIDSFFEADILSIRNSLFTTVLNPRQKEYIVEQFPELDDKVKVYLKCASQNLLPRSLQVLANPKYIFWPFRLSDKAYRWDEFIEVFERAELQKLGYTVTITDPNESSKNLPAYVRKIEPTKEQYYDILSSKPCVIMLDDIDTVLHPGTIELFFYGCQVISFESSLIDNPNSVKSIVDIPKKLSNLMYDCVDVSEFVFGDDVSSVYNKVYITDKLAKGKNED